MILNEFQESFQRLNKFDEKKEETNTLLIMKELTKEEMQYIVTPMKQRDPETTDNSSRYSPLRSKPLENWQLSQHQDASKKE